MAGQIRIPVVNPDQRINRQAIADLPEYLSDEDDAAVCRQLLEVAYRASFSLPGTTTVGMLAEMIEKSEPDTRRFFLEAAEKISGVAEIKAEREREAAERAARIRQMHRPSRLVLTPTGYRDVAEERLEADRQQAELASLAAAREHEQQQREVEADRRREHQQARDEQARRELPEHLQ
jgi:hypothetical protein